MPSRSSSVLRDAGLAIATASASHNANLLLAAATLHDGRSLRDLLDVDASGLDAPGKPDPTIFLEAARRLGLPPHACLVIEDAPAGIAAARRAGMLSVGVDRLRSTPATELLNRLAGPHRRERASSPRRRLHVPRSTATVCRVRYGVGVALVNHLLAASCCGSAKRIDLGPNRGHPVTVLVTVR